MRIELLNSERGWIGLSLQLSSRDVDALIARLALIRADPSQHFHLATAPTGDEPFIDIEVSGQADGDSSNAAGTGLAIAPDEGGGR